MSSVNKFFWLEISDLDNKEEELRKSLEIAGLAIVDEDHSKDMGMQSRGEKGWTKYSFQVYGDIEKARPVLGLSDSAIEPCDEPHLFI